MDSVDTMAVDSPSHKDVDHLPFLLFSLVVVACLCGFALYLLRKRRLNRQAGSLPTYHAVSHQRSPSVSNFGTDYRNESVFVYDEKMNLIHNSSGPNQSPVPEIHITFPDEDDKSGSSQRSRVVVVHVTDSGSVGMSPLNRDQLPPYQKEDADRFQSLDLERIGGLREKEPPEARYS